MLKAKAAKDFGFGSLTPGSGRDLMRGFSDVNRSVWSPQVEIFERECQLVVRARDEGAKGTNAADRHQLRDASLISGVNEASREEKSAEGLAALLETHRGGRHIIVLQGFPDPDAISSALAHQMIAASYRIECDICYDGVLSHHENVALVELLDIPMVRVSEGHDLSQYQASVLSTLRVRPRD